MSRAKACSKIHVLWENDHNCPMCFYVFQSWQRADQEWSAGWTWPTGCLLKTPALGFFFVQLQLIHREFWSCYMICPHSAWVPNCLQLKWILQKWWNAMRISKTIVENIEKKSILFTLMKCCEHSTQSNLLVTKKSIKIFISIHSSSFLFLYLKS